MWNKSTVNVAVKTTLDVVNPVTNEVFTIQFLVVNNNFHCLLDLEAVKSMNLVTVNCNTFIACVVMRVWEINRLRLGEPDGCS